MLTFFFLSSTANLNWTASALGEYLRAIGGMCLADHCMTAILAYDYLLTFPREVRFVWTRKFSPATALFLLNRYLIILLYFVDFITLFPIIPSVRVYSQMHWSESTDPGS